MPCVSASLIKKKPAWKRKNSCFSVLYGRKEVGNLKANTWSTTARNSGKEAIKIFLTKLQWILGDAHRRFSWMAISEYLWLPSYCRKGGGQNYAEKPISNDQKSQ